MSINDQMLIEAIRAKCQQEHWFGPDALKPTLSLSQPEDPFVDDEGEEAIVRYRPAHFDFAFPPATEEQVRVTEARVGFSLPPLLRHLLLSLANGGFGPGTGLPGVKDGYTGAYQQYDGSLWAYVAPQRAFSYATYHAQAAQSLSKGYRAGMLVPSGEGLEHLLPLVDLGCCQMVGVDSQERLFLMVPTEQNAYASLSQLPWTLEAWLWRWVHGKKLLLADDSLHEDW